MSKSKERGTRKKGGMYKTIGKILNSRDLSSSDKDKKIKEELKQIEEMKRYIDDAERIEEVNSEKLLQTIKREQAEREKAEREQAEKEQAERKEFKEKSLKELIDISKDTKSIMNFLRNGEPLSRYDYDENPNSLKNFLKNVNPNP